MKIAVDIMGGDNAPKAVLEGCALALPQLAPDTELILYGTEEALSEAKTYGLVCGSVRCVTASEVVGCDESPTLAIRKKKDSSLVRALNDVASGEADCIVSAGNTGALLTGATLIVKRLPGVKRPALAAPIPNVKGGRAVLIDSSAKTDCKPEHLQQFAIMGSAYAEKVMGVMTPRVGLLNNGAEEEKGNELTKTAHQLLKQTSVNFVGNCEARDALTGEFDVIVADGFDGNVLLKGIEGTAGAMMSMLKTSLYGSLRTKIGALLANLHSVR